MTVQRRRDFPIHIWASPLEEAGWDVSLEETLIATRAETGGFFLLKVDRGGRVYLRRTFIAASPSGQTVTKEGRDYVYHEERTVTREVVTQLDPEDDFWRVLVTMQDLVLNSKTLID